jgi:hypothetical protein
MDALGNHDDHPDDMTPRRPWIRVTRWVAAALVVGFVTFAAGWWIEGGRWVRVETPSMGRVAPVGTLLWIKPVAFDQLKVGDFITFHPPGNAQRTFSHRVYKIDADHTIQTKGVIPAPDPWRLTASDIVGKVHMRWWGFGWVVVAAPILLIGSLIVGFVVSRVRARWKLPVGLVLASLVLTVAISVYRPFVNAEQIAFAPSASGGASASYVGTGLLPIRMQAQGGPHVVLKAGQIGTVHVTAQDNKHKLRVMLSPAIPWSFWVGLVLCCMIPGAYSLIVGVRPVKA